MKKHAKKSLLFPILAFFSVVVICACAYIVQTFTANAETNTENSSTEVNAGMHPYTANVHLSTYDPFSLWVDVDGVWKKDFAWTGVYSIDFEGGGELSYYVEKYDSDIHTYIDIYDRMAKMANGNVDKDGSYEICSVAINDAYYHFLSVAYNWNYNHSEVDISIEVTPSYYICFDINANYEGYQFATFNDGSLYKFVNQGEFANLNVFDRGDIFYDDNNVDFGGWYTDPVGGQLVTENTLASSLDGIHILYAHWLNFNIVPITFNFSANDGQPLYIEYYQEGCWEGDDDKEDEAALVLIDGIPHKDDYLGFAYNVTVVIPQSNFMGSTPCRFDQYYLYDDYDYEYDGLYVYMDWYYDADEDDYDGGSCLYVGSPSWLRLNGLNINGCDMGFSDMYGLVWLPCDQNNEVVINEGLKVPGFMSVASNDGSMFKCTQTVYDIFNEELNSIATKEDITDYMPIYVAPDEYVFYGFGMDYSFTIDWDKNSSLLGAQQENLLNNNHGVPLNIIVSNLYGNIKIYQFSSLLTSSFDWFDLNSYILGASIDGQELPVSDHAYILNGNGFHTFELRMSDKEPDTKVTYKANGGKFADDTDTLTLDATYGEELPSVENPTLAGNDFVGWFTEPVGGFKVDPAHYLWMPWDRWAGVTLYAHWVEAPVPPVPPEPVPPEPVPPVPPTPDPVNPDVPGGGGIAQTGDSMPLVPIAALAVIAALGCGLAIRKEYF